MLHLLGNGTFVSSTHIHRHVKQLVDTNIQEVFLAPFLSHSKASLQSIHFLLLVRV